ncbi:unnamed protein product [Rangifer tarandus platyrhynchus]|uniref:Uncharacterized protein n=1 Tax=Rangifer tarandus platyrhynchus TaxID=3082113 RepID=A0ABN8Y3Z5_RANTA|nr:unnamed protein product [Rangifer tarandus platyrhynchus]
MSQDASRRRIRAASHTTRERPPPPPRTHRTRVPRACALHSEARRSDREHPALLSGLLAPQTATAGCGLPSARFSGRAWLDLTYSRAGTGRVGESGLHAFRRVSSSPS